jgi:hypothetical protein
MARATFTNEQLCIAWAKQFNAKPQGTRGDVVADLMGQMDLDPSDVEASRKVYNNVTQRFKQLSNHPTAPVVFPTLAPGKKGARRTDDQMASLQALMAPVVVDEDEDEDEGDEPLVLDEA